MMDLTTRAPASHAQPRTNAARRFSPRAAWWCVVAAYVALGLAVLAPEAVYSGDIGVKYVQAKALAQSGLTSLDLPYPGEFIDPSREFFPMRPPFVMTSGGATQAIFSPASAAIQSVAVAVAGIRGLVLLSIASAGLILYSAWRLAPQGLETPVVVALGVAGPLWFYAVTGWEHAPAVAFATAGFACGLRSTARAAPLVAGLLVGLGATVRDEVILVLPGLLFGLWTVRRSIGAAMAALAGAIVPLAGAMAMEVWWFGRPAAAHLRHAVHLLQSALQLTEAPNPDVPVLEPMTLGERFGTVVNYWLLGYDHHLWVAVCVAALLAALALRLKWKSAAGVLAWAAIVAALALADMWELLTAPKWFPGLLRVSPFLAFALLPPPAGDRADGSLRRVLLLTTLAYLVLAFAGTDTSGGKSLGPRLLLPLLPLLVVAAVEIIAAYVRSPGRLERYAGATGIALVAIAAVGHGFGTVRAYYDRNKADAAVVRAVAGSRERIVVTDDAITAQLLFPLYYRKIILLAETGTRGRQLGELLRDRKTPSALFVSRRLDPVVGLVPLQIAEEETDGRMVLQRWVR